jgi:hypothetical protein
VESVTCPGCQKPIRVPADVLGQTAKCPFCKCHFRAPVRTPEGLTDPVLLRRNLFARNRTAFPAVLMLLVGFTGILNNSVVALKSYFDRPAFEAGTREYFEQLASQAENEDDRERIRAKIPGALKWRPTVSVISGLLSVVTVAGAVAMVRRRGYTVALTAGFVTMLNVLNVCCFAGIFVGGYALYVLLDPGVRALFRLSAPRAT